VATWWSPFVDGPTSNLAPAGINKIHPRPLVPDLTTRALGVAVPSNSGVAYEAPYFGKRVHALAPLTVRPAWRGAAADAASHASLDDVVLTPDFWRTVLAPHTCVTASDGMRLRPKPNRLRIALDSFWNYQQIDTDRIPRPMPGGDGYN
jgi:hypothetical protein